MGFGLPQGMVSPIPMASPQRSPMGFGLPQGMVSPIPMASPQRSPMGSPQRSPMGSPQRSPMGFGSSMNISNPFVFPMSGSNSFGFISSDTSSASSAQVSVPIVPKKKSLSELKEDKVDVKDEIIALLDLGDYHKIFIEEVLNVIDKGKKIKAVAGILMRLFAVKLIKEIIDSGRCEDFLEYYSLRELSGSLMILGDYDFYNKLTETFADEGILFRDGDYYISEYDKFLLEFGVTHKEINNGTVKVLNFPAWENFIPK